MDKNLLSSSEWLEEENPFTREKEWLAFFKHSQRILGLFLMFTFLTAGVVLAILSFQKKESGEIEKTNVLGAESSPTAIPVPLLAVDLGGAVNQTGVFRLPEGSRWEDLLNLAGGLSAAADPDWVAKNLNLAARLFDGEKIYIPSRAEVATGANRNGVPSGTNAPRSGMVTKVNLNTATVAQLDALPGLSPADAQGIVEYRQKNGPFRDISEVQRVSGIKAGKFAKIKDLITVN
jgi:competence protein ComEA